MDTDEEQKLTEKMKKLIRRNLRESTFISKQLRIRLICFQHETKALKKQHNNEVHVFYPVGDFLCFFSEEGVDALLCQDSS